MNASKRMVRKCQGGPFDGQELALRSGTTCNLVVGEWRGRYSLAHKGNIGGDKLFEVKSTLVWEPTQF